MLSVKYTSFISTGFVSKRLSTLRLFIQSRCTLTSAHHKLQAWQQQQQQQLQLPVQAIINTGSNGLSQVNYAQADTDDLTGPVTVASLLSDLLDDQCKQLKLLSSYWPTPPADSA